MALSAVVTAKHTCGVATNLKWCRKHHSEKNFRKKFRSFMMLYKSLFLLVFSNMFNQAYQLQEITCPKWIPGSNRLLPAGVTLSPSLELKNRVRCFCEVVKAKEQECINMRIPRNICTDRTAAWVEDNLMLRENFRRAQAPVPQRDRMINIEP
jgi:hypothetical protein